jgi:UDP-N-acetylglucosamine:LPS N-acetylglucosamine transferase
MKALSIFSSTLLLLFTVQTLANNVIVPEIQTFEPKTIHIASTGGGLSHIAWTLEIGKVLAQRGHNVSFITTDPNVKFGKPFQPDIKTISMGPHISQVEFRDLFDIEMPFSPSVTKAYRTVIKDCYKRDYYAYLNIFGNSNTALAICDQMALPCFDAAKKLNIPLIMHMTMSLSEGKKNRCVYMCECH